MTSFKSNLMRSAAALPITLGLAAGVVAIGTVSEPRMAISACNPCAAAKAACNPCAAAKACNPCNPCAAAKASNPCAAAKACNPCNPCAAAKACNPCNPCSAAKACNPCNPCKAACGACNPCNPCAASAAGAATGCYVPRLKTASACNPCAAAKACNPCNPCSAAKACNPCNPCAAAKACNPCNPCAAAKACNPCAAAKACNPCNPCAAAASVELTNAEAVALYDCLKPVMTKSYKGGKHWAATRWAGFTRVSTQPYASATHGGRQVQNLVNKIGRNAYKKFDDITVMPIGSTIAKPSFTVGKDGQAHLGPLFIMEKMTRGFNADTANWRYAAILPGGNTMGVTKATNSAAVAFCHECHVAGEDNDYMLLIPDEYRVK